MATMTLDTLKLARKLEASGFTRDQAIGAAEAISDALNDSTLVTRSDLFEALAPLKADMLVVKWMIGFMLAGIASLVAKSFF